ncbi:MAG: ABC transporter permease [Bacteroidales bacterium]|nr:ABC transporter permease [Bacteroidales bacterium]MDD2426037.1 ABC transporter permease [Bacteroidales bacterium]MDD3990257.1 ABC transporter permease [Bacteroidales bacterium]
MDQFLTFVQKEFYHILRDRWTTIILLILPVLMLILFGYGISTEVKNTKFAVYDPSRDAVTQGIVTKLASSEYFSLGGYLTGPSEIEKCFTKSDYGLVVVFGTNFSSRLTQPSEAQIELIADGSDPNTASILTTYASALINSYLGEQIKGGFIKVRETSPLITPEVKLLYNPAMKNSFNTVPGIMGVVIILICALMTSVSLTREKEYGTMEVLLASPMKPILIIFSKVIPYFCLSLVNLATILTLARYMLGVPIKGSFVLVVFVSLLYIFVSLALGLLISTVAKKQIVALLISGAGLMLPVVYLSGMLFPLESLPAALQWIANIIPAKWYIIAMRNIMIKGLGFSSVIREVVILSVMAAFLITASFKRFKIRLE